MRSRSPVPVPLYAVPSLQLPLFSSYIRAGYPNPAEDYIERAVNVSDIIIRHPEATYLLVVAGDSMVNAGIFEGDYVVVDRALSVQQHDVIVAEVEGEFTIKRYERKNDALVLLLPENPTYSPLVITPETQASIFGVVTFTIHGHRPRGRRRRV